MGSIESAHGHTSCRLRLVCHGSLRLQVDEYSHARKVVQPFRGLVCIVTQQVPKCAHAKPAASFGRCRCFAFSFCKIEGGSGCSEN